MVQADSKRTVGKQFCSQQRRDGIVDGHQPRGLPRTFSMVQIHGSSSALVAASRQPVVIKQVALKNTFGQTRRTSCEVSRRAGVSRSPVSLRRSVSIKNASIAASRIWSFAGEVFKAKTQAERVCSYVSRKTSPMMRSRRIINSTPRSKESTQDMNERYFSPPVAIPPTITLGMFQKQVIATAMETKAKEYLKNLRKAATPR
eukprot:gb/GEZN01011783.1/.p1 GENE.gb/GEZN01011783.1/~~gb/GEZN01011783.1/.p1  ORF type:complete len:229 (+),score=8.97 gb/GEZN01011783.1/:83-688(+)